MVLHVLDYSIGLIWIKIQSKGTIRSGKNDLND